MSETSIEQRIDDLKCADNVAIEVRKKIHERLTNIEKHAADILEQILRHERRVEALEQTSHKPVTGSTEDFWRRLEAIEEWQKKAEQFKFPTT